MVVKTKKVGGSKKILIVISMHAITDYAEVDAPFNVSFSKTNYSGIWYSNASLPSCSVYGTAFSLHFDIFILS